ncbi:MAG: YaiI/YqxD family protein [Actinobacteria bacterium]|nr:YaiI/YqxD family protein [Actinomycetota bacterium]
MRITRRSAPGARRGFGVAAVATLFIDADACPVTREAVAIGRRHGMRVVIVANSTQNLERYASRTGVETVQVSSGRDAADFAVVERLSPRDTVVTQDIGLAAMAIGRGAGAIGPRGRVFHLATIDAELAVRHAEAKLRRQGGRHGGPPKFTDEDREHFEEQLERLLTQMSQ